MKTKRILSVLLSVVLILSAVSVTASAYSWDADEALTVDEAVAKHEAETGQKVETNRYYFLMPDGTNGERGIEEWATNPETGEFLIDPETGDYIVTQGEYEKSWYNEYAGAPCIYWWGTGVADPNSWVGHLASGVDENDNNVYYADVPKEVPIIIWNNGVDGGMDNTLDIYYKACQTCNIPSEYYEAGECYEYPEGTESFDNMIFVITPDLILTGDFSLKQTSDGMWYYYYGNGCYGYTKDGDETTCERDDHFDEDGNHIEKPVYILGDVDNDQVVSVMDATEIQMVLAQIKDWAYESAELAADYDKDGTASVMDATEIQLTLAGLK